MGIIADSTEKAIRNPAPARDTFAGRLAWLNDGPDNDLDGYPGPSWDDEGYTPTPEEDAEVLGWELGLEGGPEPYTSDDYSVGTGVVMAALRGWARGGHERQERAWREEREYDAWLEDLARERDAELMLEDARAWVQEEVIRAVGSVEARRRAD